ncbi:KAP family NTPase [Acuticoccus sp. M5D2P5]|nr:KAP family NTPase [Acuticoccus kalidii]
MQDEEPPLMVFLDSPFGAGKTTFLKMWAAELRQAGHPVVYFDAVAHDHVENAFIALAAELASLAPEASEPNLRIVEIAARAGRFLTRAEAPPALLAADMQEVNARLDRASAQTDDLTGDREAYVRRLIAQQPEERRALAGFRDGLTTFAKELGETVQGTTPRHPLIIILDEIDRCRRSFTLDLLETSRYLFSVANIHFVLSANHASLENAVSVAYGAEESDGRTLRSFYDIALSLPDMAFTSHATRVRYIEDVARRLSPNGPRDPDHAATLAMLAAVAEVRAFTPRTIERIVTIFTYGLAMTPRTMLKLAPILMGLSVMKVCDPKLFERAKSGALTAADVEAVLRFQDWPEGYRAEAGSAPEWWMSSVDGGGEGEGTWDRMRSDLFSYYVQDRKTLIPSLARNIVERFLPEE